MMDLRSNEGSTDLLADESNSIKSSLSRLLQQGLRSYRQKLLPNDN